MDIKTVRGRIKHEGFSFLTITLPSFGKDFERCLEQGFADRRLFTGFRWKGGLPLFLGGFLGRVFDASSGKLLDDPCIDSILSIRQLTLMFGKIAYPCSDTRKRQAMRKYIECEKDVLATSNRLSPIDLERFHRVSTLLFDRVFKHMDLLIQMGELTPKHGPGVTADKLLGNQKYRQYTWPARLQEMFPSLDHLLPSPNFVWELEKVDILEPDAEIPVRVVSVPKTLKTPRIIGIEPTAMQYAQQAILPVILDGLARDYNLDAMLGFDDQTPNQRMARKGSLNGELATLDLSDASDRVSNQLVCELFTEHPSLYKAVQACRSLRADVPGHGIVSLSKFASMGSALCFPMEAMVFLTLIFMGIEDGLSRPLNRKDVKHLRDQVRVYGDDIIVPVRFVHSVVESLQLFGAVVNSRKSFWNGKFRESCGKEYYAGEDVSIVRVREAFPNTRRDAAEVISLVSLRNQLYFAGYWSTCEWLDEKISGLLKHFPVVLPSSPVLGRHSHLGFATQRMHDDYHSPLVRGYTVSAPIPENSLEDHGALLKYFLKRGGKPSFDEKHLERSGRPQSVYIKLRFASAV